MMKFKEITMPEPLKAALTICLALFPEIFAPLQLGNYESNDVIREEFCSCYNI